MYGAELSYTWEREKGKEEKGRSFFSTKLYHK